MKRILSGSLLAAIHAYRAFVSPLLPRCCRFYPSCSEYAIDSIEKYGPWRGVVRSIRRVFRCHPWHPGGYDPAD